MKGISLGHQTNHPIGWCTDIYYVCLILCQKKCFGPQPDWVVKSSRRYNVDTARFGNEPDSFARPALFEGGELRTAPKSADFDRLRFMMTVSFWTPTAFRIVLLLLAKLALVADGAQENKFIVEVSKRRFRDSLLSSVS